MTEKLTWAPPTATATLRNLVQRYFNDNKNYLDSFLNSSTYFFEWSSGWWVVGGWLEELELRLTLHLRLMVDGGRGNDHHPPLLSCATLDIAKCNVVGNNQCTI